MYRRYLRAVLLGVFAFCVVMTSEIVKPVGPKMCDRLCKHRVGCSSYNYSHYDLSCHLTVAKDGKHLYTEKKDTDRKNGERNLTCPEGAVIFRTRANKLLCRSLHAGKQQSCKKPARKFPTQTDRLQCRDNCSQQRREKEKRLLMLPYIPNRLHSDDSQGRQLFLHNNSVVPCQYISNVSATAVAYVSTARKLIIATVKPKLLYYVSLDQSNTSIIMRNHFITSITVDEEMLHIFLVFKYPVKIGVLTIEGKYNRTAMDLTGGCSSPTIAADPKRTMIYVVCKKRCIFKYTYNGIFKGYMVKGHLRPSLYLDLKNDVLYYMSGMSSIIVASISLSTGSYTQITELPLKGETLYVIENIVYVFDRNMKWTVVPEKGYLVSSINSGFDPHRVRRVVSCLIA